MASLPVELQPVVRTIADACRVAREVQQNLHRVIEITKDDRSPVTVADFAVQAIVALDLHARDAGVRIVGEESADALRQPEQAAIRDAVITAVQRVRPQVDGDAVLTAIDACDHDATSEGFWTLDPIDGTKGFLRGQQYAIALGWIEHGVVHTGLMGCPNLPRDMGRSPEDIDDAGTLFAATRGGGAWSVPADDPEAVPVPVTTATWQAGTPVRVCESVEAAHSKHSDVVRILEQLGATRESVRIDSQCKYAVVARGQADSYLRLPTRQGYVEKIWDHAAGCLIATEAGAVVSDITGATLDFSQGAQLERNRGIVCGSPTLHGRVIEAIEAQGIGEVVA